jgi:hypothetical protein
MHCYLCIPSFTLVTEVRFGERMYTESFKSCGLITVNLNATNFQNFLNFIRSMLYIHETIAINCYTDVLSAQFCSKKNQHERQELLLVL